MDEGITMSQREVDRLEVVQQVADRQLGQARAAQRLAVSVRQVKRLVRAYRSAGEAALVSQRRGQPSNRRTAGRRAGTLCGTGAPPLFGLRTDAGGPTSSG